MKKYLTGLMLIILPSCQAAMKFTPTASRPVMLPAPVLLPNVEETMKSPGFWINRCQKPDAVMLTTAEISQLNSLIQNTQKTTIDISKLPNKLSGKPVETDIRNLMTSLTAKKLYRLNGEPITDSDWKQTFQMMNLDNISEMTTVRFAMVVHFTNQRLIPTSESWINEPWDVEFDQLQNSGLDVGTPVAVVHHSKDNNWAFVKSPISDGWVDVKTLAYCSRDQQKEFSNASSFVTVSSAKADIFLKETLTDYYDTVRMGCRFPVFKQVKPNVMLIFIPTRKSDGTLIKKIAFIERDDICEGFLPLTQRNVINQAFELLNAPYSWGDKNGEQDCSRFIQEISSVMGIQLPRNSTEQAEAGKTIIRFDPNTPDNEKLNVIAQKAIPGIAIFQFENPNHIGLYLGAADNKQYVMHASWGYHQNEDGINVIRVMNRIVISDLTLGEGGIKGTLLQRLKRINTISK